MPDAGEPVVDQSVEEVTADRQVPVTFSTGRAGTGKTYALLRESEAPDSSIQLCATTGIAAVNLGTTTLNATLGYFDTNSLRDSYLNGQLTRRIHELALHRRWLAIDEGSMLEADQLDLVYRGVEEANRYRDVVEPLGIRLVGDFAQLPPVQGRWAFEADCWRHFAAATTRLEKVWRQDGGAFLDALNAAREGNGGLAAEILTDAGAVWHTSRDEAFDGTTILPKNALVNRHNALVLSRHPGKVIEVRSRRWGKQRSEWGENARTHEWGIPPIAEFKVGAYVMILANAPDFSWVNGDCGKIVEIGAAYVEVELVRNGQVERIEKIVRHVEKHEKPDDVDVSAVSRGEYLSRPHTRRRVSPSGRSSVAGYVLGQVEFFPLRLAWSSTVHKSQGLSLDRCQVDFRDNFFAHPAMLYVALSRCRTLAGLRLVGQREIFVRACQMDARVKEWI